MAFIPTNTILSNWQATLLTINVPGSNALLFDKANVFADKNMVEALQKSLTFTDRAVFLLPLGERHHTEKQGQEYVTTRTTDIMMVVLDRDWNPYERAALVGNGSTILGVLAIKDILIDYFTGQSLGITQGIYGVRLEPGEGQSMLLQDATRKQLPGREAWAMQWSTWAGRMATKQNRLGRYNPPGNPLLDSTGANITDSTGNNIVT